MTARDAAPRALLLDLDGTLADSVYAQVAAWQHALASHGLPLPGWRVHRALGQGADALRRELERTRLALPAAAAEPVRAAHAEALAPLIAHVQPCPGAPELSRTVRRLRMPTAVVTGGHRDVAERLLRAALGESDWMLFVAGVDAAAKPAPDTLELAARELGVEPAHCWYVGDSAWDMQAASAAGAVGIGVRTGGRSAGELGEAGAREVFDDLHGVVAALVASVEASRLARRGEPA